MMGAISIQSTTSQQLLLDCVPVFFVLAAALDEAVTVLDGMLFDGVRRLKKRKRIVSLNKSDKKNSLISS